MLDREQQLTFLVELAAELTIWARDTYEAGTEEVVDPHRLREFNELLHRVTSHLSDLMARRSDRRPDEMMARLIVEAAGELRCERALSGLVERCMARPVAAKSA